MMHTHFQIFTQQNSKHNIDFSNSTLLGSQEQRNDKQFNANIFMALWYRYIVHDVQTNFVWNEQCCC